MTKTTPRSKNRVYIVGYEPSITKMWYRREYEIMNNPETADILCFIGGWDINPDFYGEKPLKGTRIQPADDLRDHRAWERTMAMSRRGQLKVGICRGGQFLNVMNDGGMYQHVTGHMDDHKMYDTLFRDTNPIWVTSSHHQMMVPTDKAEVLGYSENISKEFWTGAGKLTDAPEFEPEVLYYEDSRSFCFQGHPEWNLRNPKDGNYDTCRDYFFKVMDMIR